MTILKLEESNLSFQFKEGLFPVKFDETNFYVNHFITLQGSKGVDFIVFDDKTVYFIEVKNFSGYEIENKNRLIANSEQSLALEVSRKVRDSIACLVGAYKNSNEVLSPYFNRLKSRTVDIKVILFLEGKFHNETAVFRAITDEMKNRMKWLTTKVIVENIRLTKGHIYSINRLAND
ncbi:MULTISPECIES: DUF6661 family protein [Paenibacillus]|uniref:NERD domain-containing protein n=1 Tax=Paenibacillus helianthi TaxID=1349432 RepID=A0ABX3ELM1_9BACL|nr:MULTISPECIES: DUF6661 family protein [Paenibacillus]OKP85109.1 hypothetical protein A3844_17820 [Paenibacillus helianthi]OKP94448.1 hypothetical protein A3848_00185 [Paenibacillus sp. P32E]